MNRPKTVNDWLEYCQTCSSVEMNFGLERVHQILEQTRWHQFTIPVVTVAGTNGKGSTIAILGELLRQLDYRVGIYTSPHLIHYNERIRLDHQPVSDEQLCKAFTAVEQARGAVPLTYFEFGTLVALYLFQQVKLDVVLLEVGLGGRLDAVNVVDADIAVITQLGFDHTDWLGDTLSEIALEKGGIMRPNVPVVVAQTEPPQELRQFAQELGAPWFGRDQFGSVQLELAHILGWGLQQWDWYGTSESGETVELSDLPPPKLPVVSVATALQVLQLLLPKLSITPLSLSEYHSAISAAIDRAYLLGRMTFIPSELEKHPSLLLDIAHNEQSVSYLADRLDRWCNGEADGLLGNYKGGKVVALLGALQDKPVAKMITIMAPYVDHWVPLPAESSRALSSKALTRLLAESQVDYWSVDALLSTRGEATRCTTVYNACDKAYTVNSGISEEMLIELVRRLLSTLKQGNEEIELVVVFGSFYLVGPVLQAVK